MGLGRFGGGLGVTRWLAARGADVLVTDLAGEDDLRDSVTALRPLIEAGSVELRLGGHNVSDFTTCDLVVANPAVPRPWENRFLRAADAAGIEVVTEIQLALESHGAPAVAVTGTAGKSSTTAMVAAGLRGAGLDPLVGGNLGGSLLEIEPDASRSLVVELSSAMLHWLTDALARARVGVVTTFSENHLDWHGDLEHYRASKRKLVGALRAGDTAVLGADVAGWPSADGVRRVVVGDELDRLAVLGEHQRRNAALARAACVAMLGEDRVGEIESGIRGFRGLPHRLCELEPIGGVRLFDDSKCTTPAGTARAVEALRDAGLSGIHLIVGGYDKGVDLSSIGRLGVPLYTIGATGPEIAAVATEVLECGTLEVAASEIASRARAGDAVLLSPGCASWDQFENFEARGRAFAEAMRAALGGRS